LPSQLLSGRARRRRPHDEPRLEQDLPRTSALRDVEDGRPVCPPGGHGEASDAVT
jgi:hypothetical protein